MTTAKANTAQAATVVPAEVWWGRRRWRYNAWLVAAFVLGFIAYLFVLDGFSHVIGRPIVDEAGRTTGYFVDSGGIEVLVQLVGGGAAILIANVCYNLGAWGEEFVSPAKVGFYRTAAWRAGVAFSCLLPFSVAVLHLVMCLFFPDAYDHTPITPHGF